LISYLSELDSTYKIAMQSLHQNHKEQKNTYMVLRSEGLCYKHAKLKHSGSKQQ